MVHPCHPDSEPHRSYQPHHRPADLSVPVALLQNENGLPPSSAQRQDDTKRQFFGLQWMTESGHQQCELQHPGVRQRVLQRVQKRQEP